MRIRLLLSLAAVLLWLPVASVSAQAAIDSNATSTLRVLFIGNSLTYVNNLPRLVRAIAAAQPDGPRIKTTTYVAAGGSLAERWHAGTAADVLRSGHWDALVLQESSGLQGCMAVAEHRRERRCRESEIAHKHFSELAKAAGARVLLLTTWGPDTSFQGDINQGYDMLASALRHDGVHCIVVPAARALDRYASKHTQKVTRPDGLHPGLPASLLMAVQLYEAITDRQAQAHDVIIDFPLLPVVVPLTPGEPLEAQPQFAATPRTYLLKAAAIAPLLEVARASH